jgi:hypothetical protein
MGNAPAVKIIMRPGSMCGVATGPCTGNDVPEIQEILPLFLPVFSLFLPVMVF